MRSTSRLVICALALGFVAQSCSDDQSPGSPEVDGAASAADSAPADAGPVDGPADALAATDAPAPAGDSASNSQDGGLPSADSGMTTPTFKQHVVDSNPDKPAFVTTADLDNDGKLELVVSVFAGSSPVGNGLLTSYAMGASVSAAWTKQVLVPKSKGIKFPNAVTAADIDGDKDLDLFLPYGFLACVPFSCGGLAWLENKGSAGFAWHDIVPKGNALFYHHVEFVDISGDKIKDVVTVGESKGLFDAGKAVTQIFLGNPTASDRFEKTPQVVGPGLGSLPTVLDIDGDGDLDIASAEYFIKGESAAWYERKGSAWNKHVITAAVGPSIQLSFIDGLLGPGKRVPVLANHTNTADNATNPESAVFVLQIPADPTKTWQTTKISKGIKSRKSPAMGPQGAPGVFSWGDLDGDKDIDLIVSGDGDPQIYWLEQQAGGSFKTHVLAKNLPQSGVTAADLDGDGAAEIVVSSYEANKLLVFKK